MKILLSSSMLLASAALMVSVAMRAVMGVLARLLTTDMGVLEQVSLRSLFGALILMCLFWNRMRWRRLLRVPARDAALIALRAIAMFVVGMSLGTEAFIEGNYITTTLVLALPTTAIVCRACFGERLSWPVVGLVMLSFVGVLVIVQAKDESLLLGMPLWCALGAAFAMSWGMLAARWQTDHVNAFEASFWMLLISAILAGLLAWVLTPLRIPRADIHASTLWTAAAAGMASVGFLWMSDYAIPRLQGVVVNNILAMQPVFGALIGYLVYGEALSVIQWCGAALIMLSVCLIANVSSGPKPGGGGR